MAYCGHCGFEYEPKLMKGFCTNCGSRLEGAMDVSDVTMSLSRVPSLSARLAVKRGGPVGHTFDLTRDRVTIGSEPTSAVPLDHSSVSPSHAIIRVSQGRFVLYDAGSASGSLVNGEQVTGELLTFGTRITIGSSEILFTRGEPGQEAGALGVLAVQSGPSKGRSCPVGGRNVIIGRRPGEGGLLLDDRAVSQRHALVQPTTHGCILYDLASNNGTLLDGVPVRGRPLHDGDVLKVGEVELQFVQGSA